MTFDERIQRAISVYVFTIQTESSKYATIPEDDLRESMKIALALPGPPDSETRKAYKEVERLFDEEYRKQHDAQS